MILIIGAMRLKSTGGYSIESVFENTNTEELKAISKKTTDLIDELKQSLAVDLLETLKQINED